MSRSKKQIKPLLNEIRTAATELHTMTQDLTMLAVINDMAREVLTAAQALTAATVSLRNAEALEIVADSDELSMLDEVVDNDAMSLLEEQFFAAIETLDEGPIGEFLNQVLEKVEKRYVRLVDAIHALNARANADW